MPTERDVRNAATASRSRTTGGAAGVEEGRSRDPKPAPPLSTSCVVLSLRVEQVKMHQAVDYAESIMIELEAIRQQLDFERRTLAPEGCILEAVPYISRLRCADSERHMISFSSLTDDIADVIIAEQAAHYRDLATQVEWKVSSRSPSRSLATR